MNEEKKLENGDKSDASTCYALVLYTYDYHEWEEAIAVSFDEDKLKEAYENLDRVYDHCKLVDLGSHHSLQETEDPHWVIKPIKFLV